MHGCCSRGASPTRCRCFRCVCPPPARHTCERRGAQVGLSAKSVNGSPVLVLLYAPAVDSIRAVPAATGYHDNSHAGAAVEATVYLVDAAGRLPGLQGSGSRLC